ncbi:hypothetical protein [Yeosuana marina]|uniref:hypothetical protein n=1 Tax=Yeosuana marina TaxID=1565536 RepID=UPI00141F43CE|nr:hypothetical protein [Yeosuana marina]
MSIILILFFISEFLTKLLDFYGVEHYRVGIVIKMMFLCYVFARKLISSSLFGALVILGLLFFFSQLGIDTGLSLKEKLLENLLYFAKYTFIFVMADYISQLNFKDIQIHKALTIILFFLRINFIAILVGILFKLDLFRTYGHDRFGYNGIIQMNSHASYIYCFATIYVVYNYLKIKKITLDFWIIIISGLLIGTKTLYFFYALVGVYLIFHLKLYKKFTFYILFLLLVVAIFLSIDILSLFLSTHLKPFVILYNDYGFITAITSTRDLLLMETLNLASQYDWSFINYLIGGGFFNILRTEMAFVDLFFFWGIIGMVLYLSLYYKYIIRHYLYNAFLKYAIFSVLLSAFFGGNYFTNAVTAIYILVFSNFFTLEKIKNSNN